MLIENKIPHDQINPFSEYEKHLTKSTRLTKKHRFLAVLSPDGKVCEKGWFGLSYIRLVPALKAALSEHFIEQPFNKWMVLLREFLVDLEQIVSQKSAPAETVDYVFSHLQSEFNDNIFGKIENWYGYPTLRFYLSKYENSTETVLLLGARKGHAFRLHLYVHKIDSNALRDQAGKLLRNPRVEELSAERHETIRAYREILESKEINNVYA